MARGIEKGRRIKFTRLEDVIPGPTEDSVGIPVYGRNAPTRHTFISKRHFERVVAERWSASNGYPRAYIGGKSIYLHRFLLEPPPGYQIDHIDGDTFNNTDENLRLCKSSQNLQNRGLAVNNKSGFKGVIYDARRSLYRAEISARDIKRKFLGYYPDAESAARAYDAAALEHYGEFARLNFPEDK